MNITESKKLDRCLISGEEVVKILDLGQHAYADTFIAEDQLHLSEPVFPLQLHMNPNSGHIQLGYVSDAEARYNLYKYSYTSSNSVYSRNHWVKYSEEVKQQFDPHGLIVEIGSNDGYLVGQFRSDNTRILGIDSSGDMCELARSNGIPTLHEVFCSTVADKVLQTHGRAVIVMANNVFNHANDPLDFANSVSKILEDHGKFIFEMPYWLSMVESGRFVDMVYHEHVSYFTVKGVKNLLDQVGMEIESFKVVDYHGGSLRVVARKKTLLPRLPEIEQAIEWETQCGIYDLQFYQNLEKKFKENRNRWLAEFYSLKEQDPDAVIIGVGAAAKANTWLNWHGLDHTMLHCITDSSEFKQGKYTPLSRIPIRGDEEFALYERPYALILSWNISEGLKNALLKINPKVRFLSQ